MVVGVNDRAIMKRLVPIKDFLTDVTGSCKTFVMKVPQHRPWARGANFRHLSHLGGKAGPYFSVRCLWVIGILGEFHKCSYTLCLSLNISRTAPFCQISWTHIFKICSIGRSDNTVLATNNICITLITSNTIQKTKMARVSKIFVIL